MLPFEIVLLQPAGKDYDDDDIIASFRYVFGRDGQRSNEDRADDDDSPPKEEMSLFGGQCGDTGWFLGKLSNSTRMVGSFPSAPTIP